MYWLETKTFTKYIREKIYNMQGLVSGYTKNKPYEDVELARRFVWVFP